MLSRAMLIFSKSVFVYLLSLNSMCGNIKLLIGYYSLMYTFILINLCFFCVFLSKCLQFHNRYLQFPYDSALLLQYCTLFALKVFHSYRHNKQINIKLGLLCAHSSIGVIRFINARYNCSDRVASM